MKNQIRAAALLLALICQSCISAKGPSGESLVMVGTNMGFTTETIKESKSRTGGLALLNGSYGNDDLTDTTEGTQHSEIKVGAISITGVIDQGTPTNQTMGWVWRMTRTIVTGQVFKVGLNGWANNQAAKTAADVSKHSATTASKTSLGLAKERAALIPKVNPELVPIEALKSP